VSAGGGGPAVAVVIPCFRERDNIDAVLAAIPAEVARVFVVDDACPEATGEHVAAHHPAGRVEVLRHERNLGVGAATVTGYRAALAAGADIVVKLDGDGQMPPALIPRLCAPIGRGQADYTKGNRFHRIEDSAAMPALRLAGNAVLSFLSKLSTGYWHVFDPTNGFTAIHASVLASLPLDKLDRGFFFESDMLFRLNTVRALVVDVPMRARYAGERSQLRPGALAGSFLVKHLRNFVKRIFYNYFLRDFHVASLEWLLGPALLVFGVVFGITAWREAALAGTAATPGTVMLAALPVLVGLQLLLSALQFDISAQPRIPVHPLLAEAPATEGHGD